MGFIPGAYVFPGGAVDRADGDPEVLPHLAGLSPHEARTRLGMLEGGTGAMDAARPAPVAYFVAALRETFEETGIFLGAPPGGCRTVPVGGGSREGGVRARLLEDRSTFRQALEELAPDGTAPGEPQPDRRPRLEGAPGSRPEKLDAGSLRFIGRWITPEVEPRRYDTLFFAAEVPAGCRVEPYRGEVEEALWISPTAALQRNRAGLLPLVYPTLRTLEELEPFQDARGALAHFQGRSFPPLLPQLLRKPGGIQITLDDTA
jgi:8-oxo-dGTP pyrophosphatase MutT (NUDIX family)